MIRWLKTRHFASLQAVSWNRRGTRPDQAAAGIGVSFRICISCKLRPMMKIQAILNSPRCFSWRRQRDDFQPAETFLDAFPPFLADVVAGIPDAARINCTVAWPSRVLRHVRRRVLLVLRLKTLQTRPGIQQRPIYREVLIGDQSCRTHPLDNLALRRHRIQHLQTLYPQQLFRGNRWPPAFRIHGVKPHRHLAQNLFDHRAQRTILRHQVFRRQVTEHVTLPTIKSPYDLVLTAHCVELKQLFQHPASVVSVEG